MKIRNLHKLAFSWVVSALSLLGQGIVYSPSITLESTVVASGSGFSYDYGFMNQTTVSPSSGKDPLLLAVAAIDLILIPYFPDAGIRSITSPSGWTASIHPTRDYFKLGNGAGVIEWVGGRIPVGKTPVSGFGYIADFGPARGPLDAIIQVGLVSRLAAPLPASSSALGGGGSIAVSDEFSSFSFALATLVGMAVWRQRITNVTIS